MAIGNLTLEGPAHTDDSTSHDQLGWSHMGVWEPLLGDSQIMDDMAKWIIRRLAEGARGLGQERDAWAGGRIGQRAWWSPAAAEPVLVSHMWRRLTAHALCSEVNREFDAHIRGNSQVSVIERLNADGCRCLTAAIDQTHVATDALTQRGPADFFVLYTVATRNAPSTMDREAIWALCSDHHTWRARLEHTSWGLPRLFEILWPYIESTYGCPSLWRHQRKRQLTTATAVRGVCADDMGVVCSTLWSSTGTSRRQSRASLSTLLPTAIV